MSRTDAAVAIPDALRGRVYAEARAAYPLECCGYLIGPGGPGGPGGAGGAVDDLVRCRNALAGAPGAAPVPPALAAGRPLAAGVAFALEGADLLAFARAFASARPPRVLYHSHPDGRAALSDLDRRAAGEPDGPAYPVDHLVVAVTARGVTAAAQFAWRGGALVEVARWPADGPRVGA